MLRFVEAKESGKRSSSRLLDPPNVSAASSTYRHAKQHDRGKQPDIRDKTTATCTHCGGKNHGRKAPLHVKRSDCLVYDHLCAHCSKINHFEDVCLSACEQEAATLDQLCTVEATRRWNGARSITLDHHLHNLSDRWTRQASPVADGGARGPWARNSVGPSAMVWPNVSQLGAPDAPSW